MSVFVFLFSYPCAVRCRSCSWLSLSGPSCVMGLAGGYIPIGPFVQVIDGLVTHNVLCDVCMYQLTIGSV